MAGVEATAAREIPHLLEEWVGGAVELEAGFQGERGRYDVRARTRGGLFIIEVRGADDIALIEAARQKLEAYDSMTPEAVPVVAVPYMGPKAREYARSKGLSWMDLSGNADIRAPGIRIHVEGKPNRFASRGRPSTAFSDKASRITRAMLIEPERWWRQRDLLEATGLSRGYVSKVVGRLDEDGLLDRDEEGAVRPGSPGLLLDAWAQVYDFRKHDILRFHAVGRTGPSITKTLAGGLDEEPHLRWAATGLSAAWLWTRHADHRLVTFFTSVPIRDPEGLGLRPVEKGENVRLVVPRDEGVFYAAEEIEGVRCVQPVQAYLDLLAHPERADEAASVLRVHHLGWSDG